MTEKASVKPAFEIQIHKKLKCPQCGSKRLYKDGLRYLKDGTSIQRYLCRECGYRFSENHAKKIETKILKRRLALNLDCRVCAGLNSAKNSAGTVQVLMEEKVDAEKRAAGATEIDIKSKIFEYAWWLKKQGYADVTVKMNASIIRILYKRGADIFNPESVKEVIAKQRWSENRRKNVINAYDLFAKFMGLQWEKPKCRPERKIPFIPTEEELDALIAASGKKLAAMLQLLKETGMRVGEARRLKWTDIDFKRKLIILNQPEKGSEPRIFNVSEKLINMLNNLQRKSERVFGDSPNALKASFYHKRKRLAQKLQNPRLLKIGFHTFRHWKATMEYHKTKDILHVMKLLGHKNIENTMIYINVEQALFHEENQEFHVRVAQKPDEIKSLLEAGFEYVCEKDGLLFFRKRK